MSLKTLTTREAVKQITEAIRGPKRTSTYGAPLFLLGAGASYSAGIPLGGHVADRIRDDLKGSWKKQPVEKSWMSGYEWAMSQLPKERQMEYVRQFIRGARHDDGRWRLNHCYLVLSEIWRNSGPERRLTIDQRSSSNSRRFVRYPRILLTTNFDPLFHYALIERNAER
jgi:hypothetical protein